VTFLLTSGTTAIALAWLWYVLSQYPDEEARLHEELDRELAGREPNPNDLPRLPFTRSVFIESMRLYPPAWGLVRRPIVDYELGGFRIPKNSLITFSQYLIHRDPRYYDSPEVFF